MVLGVELAWSLAPERVPGTGGGIGRSTHRRQLAVVSVVGLLAAFVTPYGPSLLFYDIGVGTNSQIGQYISEWGLPNFHSVVELVTFAIVISVFVFAMRRRRVVVLEATLAVIFFFGALHSNRISIYLYVAVAGLAASLPVRRFWGPRARAVAGALGIGLLVALASYPSVPAGTVTTDTPVQALISSRPTRVGSSPKSPRASIRSSGIGPPSPMVAPDLFIGPVLTDFFAISDVKTNPDPILARYDVNYVVWPRATPLAGYLSHDAQWVVVDHTVPALVFARRAAWVTQPRA